MFNMENESRPHPNIFKVHLTKYRSKVWKIPHNSTSIDQFKMGSSSCLNFADEQSEEKDHKAEEN